MLKSRVSRQNGVVGLDDGVGHSRGRVHTELELRLLAIVGGEALKDESTETGTGSTTEGVEDEEALKTVTVVGEAANLVHHDIDLLFANSVVTTSVCHMRVRQRHTG